MDYHTAEEFDLKKNAYRKPSNISRRYYLSDAVFLVGLEGETELLKSIYEALKEPRWTLFLGRKAFVPGRPVFFADVQDALHSEELSEVMKNYPSIREDPLDTDQENMSQEPTEVRLFLEHTHGMGSAPLVIHVQDQPIAAFSERKYRYRAVHVHTLTIGGESKCI